MASALGWLGKWTWSLIAPEEDPPSQNSSLGHAHESLDGVSGALTAPFESENSVSPLQNASGLQHLSPDFALPAHIQNNNSAQYLQFVQNSQNTGVISSIRSSTFQAQGNIRLTMDNNTVNHHHYGQINNTKDIAGWLGKDLPPRANFRAIHKEIMGKVVSGSGDWLIRDALFNNWASAPVDTLPLLWGTGMPRAGKTYLSSIVIDHLLKEHIPNNLAQGQKPVATVYVYCRHEDGLLTIHVLTALLKQLVEDHDTASRSVEDTLYTPCIKEDARPSQKEVYEALRGTINLFSCVYVVVDGIDELTNGSQGELMSTLLSLPVKVFFTSREMSLLGLPRPSFTVRPPEDVVYKVISSQLTDALRTIALPDNVNRAQIAQDLSAQIQRSSAGLFLLAEPQLSMLVPGPGQPITTLKHLRRIVQQVMAYPRDTYEGTFQRIQNQKNEETRYLALHTILLLTHATRPLKMSELLNCLSINTEFQQIDPDDRPTRDMVLTACLGLVAVDRDTDTVSLIHPTAQKFFEELKDPFFNDPHAFIANALSAYLSSIDLDTPAIASYHRLQSNRAEYPFFDYAYWTLGHHVRKSLCCPHSKLPEHVASFFREHQTMVLRPRSDVPDVLDEGSVIHFAAFHGLLSLYFIDRQRDYSGKSTLGYTPLYYACLGRQLHIVEQLFTLKQDDLEELKGTCSRSNQVQTNSNVNEIHRPGDSWVFVDDSDSAYDQLFGRSEGVEGVVNTRFLGGQTLLHVASSLGQPSVVRLLLCCDGIDVNVVEDNGQSALHAAAAKGNQSVVEQILAANNIKVNLQEHDGFAPLHLAAQNGHKAATGLLLAHPEINANIKQHAGFTPFHIAAQNGYLDVVQLFLDAPAVVRNPVTIKGSTPLHMAAQNGQEAVVRLLLASPGIDTQARTNLGFTILHLAAEKGHPSVAQLLLSTPGAVNAGATTNKRSNALHLAAQNGHESIVQTLLGCPEIDIRAKTTDGWTALHFAAQSGKEEMVRNIISCPGVQMNERGRRPHGETPIEVAIRKGHGHIVTIFQSMGIKPEGM